MVEASQKRANDSASITMGRPRLFGMVTMQCSREFTVYALKSFFAHTNLRAQDRFILISNDDPSAVELATSFPGVEVVLLKQPRGFAENGNYFIEESLRTGSDLIFTNNDVIFSENWLAPLLEFDDAVACPLSNREVQYVASAAVIRTQVVQDVFLFDAPMELERYADNPGAFDFIAACHVKKSTGCLPLAVFPFYCVRIPLPILQQVGKFDESFGRAGGEDYDYSLRAWLSGFRAQLVLSSLLLHFWGRSTWKSTQVDGSVGNYDLRFKDVFKAKWGEALFRFVVEEDDSLLKANVLAEAQRRSGDIASMIRSLQERPVELCIR
jgi:GT2 family glycosyltransferase